MNKKIISLKIDDNENGKRLDKFLTEKLKDISRSRIKKIIEDGFVKINESVQTSASAKIKSNNNILVTIPDAEPAEPIPQDIPINVVYEDEDLIIVDKPAGLVVHPAAGNADKTLVNALLAHCGESLSGIGGVKRPGIVHRIDKDTSGLIVVAKNDFTHNHLAEQFSKHSIKRGYKAIIWGMIEPKEGTIIGNIGRNSKDRKKMAVVERGGKEAITHYKTIKNFGIHATLIECRLETGRTHQIRVHLTNQGHPLIGDPVYGKPSKSCKSRLSDICGDFLKTFNRQALHAYMLGFIHPRKNISLLFESKLPYEINQLISFLE